MFDRYYFRRLDADLETWAAHGWVSEAGAAEIRRHVEAGTGRRSLPGVLGSLGALLIAASVFAFVAANWDGVPRIGKVALVYLLLAGSVGGAWAMARAGLRFGADAAAMLATLVFAGGVALIGQMYHLPADWPGGGLHVAMGAMAMAFLCRSRGALVVACAALGVWTFGRLVETDTASHPAFWIAFAIVAWLAASRPGALSRHAVVLLLAGHLGTWLMTVPLPSVGGDGEWSRAAMAAGLAAAVAAAGFALRLLSPAFGLTLAHWSIWFFAGLLGLLQFAAFEADGVQRQGLAGVAWVALAAGAVLPLAQIPLAGDRRGAALLAAALLPGLAIIPAMGWLPGVAALAAAVLALASSVGLVGAGLFAASRPVTAAGYTAFGGIVLWLMYRTVGTLLDQSIFFLAAGIVLLLLGWGARRLVAATAAEARP
ncbi:membrane protein [Allostella sp. ATCC 35155]|nr:membrane protein [Stella sp. ATCC 35155]